MELKFDKENKILSISMSNGTKIELPPQYVKELVNLLDKNKKIILDEEENDDNSSLEIVWNPRSRRHEPKKKQ